MVGFYRFVFCVLMLATCWLGSHAQSPGHAEHGVLDARAWNPHSNNLPLRGYWIRYDDKLLTPETLANHHGAPAFFPELWNNLRADAKGTGYATYTLTVRLPDTVTSLALEIPQLYSSCNVWANGRIVARVGKVGTSKEQSVPQWIYTVSSFETGTADTLQLVVQVANFHHAKGGAREPLVLGSATALRQHQSIITMMNLAETIVLFCLGAVFFVLYATQRRQRVVLYFALLCVVWAVRSMFSNLYPITLFFPDFNWAAQVRIEYLSLYAGSICSVLFLHHLFKNFGNAILTYMLVGLNILFVLFTLFTPVIVFSQWVSLYLAVAGVIVLYGGVMVIRAMLVEQAGAWFLVASIILGMIMFGYDIVAYNADSLNFVFLSIGYMLLFLLTTVALLFHLDILKSKSTNRNMLRYDDLFKKE